MQLLPSATPTGFEWTYIDPTIAGSIDFPVDMDETVIPDKAELILEVDAAAKPLLTLIWINARQMGFTYDEALLDPTVVRMQYPIMAPNFRSLAGQPVFPFDLLGVET